MWAYSPACYTHVMSMVSAGEPCSSPPFDTILHEIPQQSELDNVWPPVAVALARERATELQILFMRIPSKPRSAFLFLLARQHAVLV